MNIMKGIDNSLMREHFDHAACQTFGTLIKTDFKQLAPSKTYFKQLTWK